MDRSRFCPYSDYFPLDTMPGAGLDVVAASAGLGAEPVVSEAVRVGQRAGAEGGDRGAGAEAGGGAVEVPGAGRGAGGCDDRPVGVEAQRPDAGDGAAG